MQLPHKLALTALAVSSALACITPVQAATEQDKASSAVLFQGFHWNSANGSWYADLQSKAADLKTLGVTHVWFPPPSDSRPYAKQGYMPSQLNKLDSYYGSEAALKAATSALAAQGIKSVADIVINHRDGTNDWGDFTNPTWDCRAVVSNDEWAGKCGNADTGASYGSARDLDHTQAFVQNDIKTWLTTRIKAAGFSGIRYDYSKGYSPYYAGMYQDAMAADFCVGEVWTDLNYADVDAHRKLLMNFVDGASGKCGAFDFTTKGLLNQALAANEYWRLKDASGKPAGGIGWWAQKMVTFVDNHDTGPSESCSVGQNHWPVPCDKVMQGYAYVLTHPGVPSVYYAHVYNWGLKNDIKALLDARKAAGVTSTSAVAIQQAASGLYAAIITGTNYKLAMKIGPNAWSPSGAWTQVASGANYSVWKEGTGPDPEAPTTPTNLRVTGVTASSVSLAWSASTDNVGVAGYRVSRNGALLGSTTGTAYTDNGLAASTSYSYSVQAYDLAGNTSGWVTPPIVATTSGGNTCTSVAVTFSIANANTTFGQNLYVVGNQTPLGSWSPASSKALTIQGTGANATWTGTVDLPAGAATQYKYVKYNPSTGATVWEGNQSTASGNREFTTTTTSPCTATRADGSFKF
ncbi:alpha-amylase family glycosyl hydrolase [Niveibacterium sp. 24ML]|uniref:glucan 1,4-alpha-maltotetraohydrolase domain-containing protein n=1 Tax=Niveibacterium sp. 24ML TaxID=2985512 RepID=UPI00226FC68D|nr:glucan 1,4-alpha-maltotetraohydrolase domain-containing protein [Niveibacterium sp. 24ML]MCX9157982.1 alpha-amylase family glycosyl hydrolase [Niveibacterium sp. 24ML]